MKQLPLVALTALALIAAAHADDPPFILAANMKVLRAKMPDTTYRFLGSNAPGQLFYPDEPVNIRLVLTKPADAQGFAIEIQEITTRDPEARIKESYTDTAGAAPLIGLQGKPVTAPLKVAFNDKPELEIEVNALPVPKKLGTYALILTRGDSRQFLATVARVPHPRAYGTIENTPIFGEGQMMDRSDLKGLTMRAQQYQRMGVRGWRSELGWQESKEGVYDWSRYDTIFAAAKAADCQIMTTLPGHPWHFLPFGEPTPASGWTPQTGGYSGTGDWLAAPEMYPRYGKWIEAFCARYGSKGTGALWGLENYNEPWEGGGISGWARDLVQYRAIQKLIGTSARKVDPSLRLLAASSIMNTEDKLFSDGSNEFNQYLDIWTDHYVVPCMAYGPLVARSHGKDSMETETWFVNSEYLLPQGVSQFMAAGQKRISPWHPSVLFDKLPGTDDNYFIPTPVVAASAAFNYFVSGKEFEKMPFQNHLPFVFQFGKDSDEDALLVVFGQLITIGGSDPKEQLWAQVNSAPGGTLTIDNRDGLLQFFDLAGNPAYVGQKTVKLPMTIAPSYITCKRGPVAAAQRLAQARIEGKRPVEILPHDFTTRLATGANLTVEIHNCLNSVVTGKLTVKAPDGITLNSTEQMVKLSGGETKTLSFAVVKAEAQPSNSYPFSFAFTSDAGSATYSENLNVTIAPRGTKIVDGNLDDWADVPGVTIIGTKEKMDATELLRRPWLAVAESNPQATVGEVKLAWDEANLYIAARVNDPTPEANTLRMATRDENSYFHTAADDNRSPYKEFIEKVRDKQKNPARSFAEVPWVYARSPEAGIPFRRDRLQFALDVTPDWHDLTPDTDRVPFGFHAVPDTDYEYSLYGCEGGSELWRQLAPGVPRIHDWPRQLRGPITTGAVTSAKHVVRRDGSTIVYEAAIPKSELATLPLKAGTSFGFTFKIGNSDGPSAEYGADKAVTKVNGLTLHPYWERTPNAGVRWSLVD